MWRITQFFAQNSNKLIIKKGTLKQVDILQLRFLSCSINKSSQDFFVKKDAKWIGHLIRRNLTTGNSNAESANKKELPKFSNQNLENKSSKLAKFLIVFASGMIAFAAISYYLDKNGTKPKYNDIINYSSPNLPGKITPSKSIRREKNPGNIKLTLYQYVTCPFCCKVRAYLDYFGYSYDIVEVNSVRKNQIDWSSYKKVPILAVQFPSKEDPNVYEENIIQLNDSSVIVSALETFRLDPTFSLKEILKYYEPVEIDSKGNSKSLEYNNKYFVMLYNDKMTDKKSVTDRKLERDWRSWVDSKFIHAISPNVYRSFDEAVESFKWFDRAGEWEKQFSSFERTIIIYLGATVMYFLGKNLKKKHNLKDDVRESMQDLCNEWTLSQNESFPFRGGSSPNLADLALYGAIGSFEGCQAFSDMIQNQKIKNWYDACKEQVVNSKGTLLLNNPLFYSSKSKNKKSII